MLSCSVMSDSLGPHELYPARLLCLWDFPGKILEWVVISFSRGSSWPRDWIHVYCIFRWIFFSNWRLITLQYCSGFAIHWHKSAMGVHLFPILSLPPTSLPIPSLWVIPVHHPKYPVSCIEPGLAICFTYDNIHVSMLFFQIIPPSPSPTESKRLFYTSVFLLLSHI